MAGRIICFVGADGSGKTTLAMWLISELRKNNCPVRYVWFRFPRYSTLALLLVARLVGFTKYKGEGKHRIALHFFDRSAFRILYPLLVLWDMSLGYAIRVALPSKLGYTVVCDRYVNDIIVDTAIDTQDQYFVNGAFGRIFYKFASKAQLILFADASDKTLSARRPESDLDPYVTQRRALYRVLGRMPNVSTIDSDADANSSYGALVKLIEQKAEIPLITVKQLKVYSDVKSPILRRLVKNKLVMLASNWTFQGSFRKTWGERFFMLAVNFILAFPAFLLLYSYLGYVAAAILGIVFAHSITWTFNGNLRAFLKKRFLLLAGRAYDKQKNIDFLANLREELSGASGGISAVAAFGSLSRGEFSETSDMDMAAIRKPGLASYIKANAWVFHVRYMAFIKKIPLDLYLFDNIEQVKSRMSPNEPAVVVCDPDNIFKKTIRAGVISLQNLPELRPRQVIGELSVSSRWTNRANKSPQEVDETAYSARALVYTASPVSHYVSYVLRRQKVKLENGMLIISIDVDVGNRKVGELNRGENDRNVSRSLTEYQVGKIEERTIPILIDCLESLEVPATFAIRGQLLEVDTSIVQDIFASSTRHEIASHGYYHKQFPSLSRDEAIHELDLLSFAMKETGIAPRSFVYPTNKVAHLDLIERFGYICYRGPSEGLLRDEMRIKKSGHLYNVCPSLFINRRTEPFFVKKMIDVAVLRKLPFHLWFHPHDFGVTRRSIEYTVNRMFLPILEHAEKKAKKGSMTFETMLTATQKFKHS